MSSAEVLAEVPGAFRTHPAIYGVSTRALHQAVKRGAERFPKDFALQLSEDEVVFRLQWAAKGQVLSGARLSVRGSNELEEALVVHARENPVASREETRFGSRYVVDGPFRASSGERVELRSVWFIEAGTSVARFVTAYPIGRRRS